MKLYIVRHGETDWNIEQRIQGDSQVPLNKRGIEQAYACSQYFKDINFDKVYTSTLARAIKTTEILTDNKYGIIKSSQLSERNFGDWQTRLWKEVHEENPHLKDIWKRDGVNFAPPNGESLGQMVERVQNQLENIARVDYSLENVLMVTHGGPIKALIGYVHKTPANDIHNVPMLRNCSISLFDYKEDKFNIAFLDKVVDN